MPWQQLKVTVPESSATLIENYFSESGAVSVTFMDSEDHPVFQLEPGSTPLWKHTEVVGLFEHDAPMTSIMENLRASLVPQQDVPIVLEEVQDTEWERVCMQDFKPMQFGKRIWICPSWETPPVPDAINILLDPGLAFGTGTHPTTALCLQWLDAQDVKDRIVIDYGCGSGILAIAAALLGARQVIAIDNDPQAIQASESNRDLNGIAEQQLSVHLPGGKHPQADILVANILSGPLEELTPIIAALVKPGGKLILSGVLTAQTQSLMNSYTPYFAMAEPVFLDEWVRAEGTRS